MNESPKGDGAAGHRRRVLDAVKSFMARNGKGRTKCRPCTSGRRTGHSGALCAAVERQKVLPRGQNAGYVPRASNLIRLTLFILSNRDD